MKCVRPVLTAAVCALSLLPATVFAQSIEGRLPELVTDRPDFTESSDVVGAGIVQFEMGTSFESNGQGDARDRAFTAPLALMRLGVSRRLELRLSSDGYVLDSIGTGLGKASVKGQADMEVGAKYVFRETGQGGIAFAVIPMMSLPTGADGFTSGTVDPTVKFTWAADLPKDFGISGNFNISRLGDDLGRYTEHAVSLSLGHDLKAGWGGYWELYGFTPVGRPESKAWTANTGISHPIGGNAQIDFEIGRGLTAAAPDWFIGAGLGIRTSALRRQR